MNKIKSFFMKPGNIMGLVALIIFLVTVGYFSFNFNSKKQIEGTNQIQTTQIKTETPKTETPKPVETKSEPVTIPTKTPNNKSLNTQSAPIVVPAPILVCNESLKKSALNSESSNYNLALSYENNQYHMALAQANTCGSDSPNAYQSSCGNLVASVIAKHKEILQMVENKHQENLSQISSKCY